MKAFLAAVLGILALMPGTSLAETSLMVMSFNVWDGGANEDKTVEETVAVTRAAGADIIGEKGPEADIVVTPWPSDHRAVAAKVRF